ncbi:MAG TPA: tRNA epoxyqueuosine(34) reductase QueG [Chloroflexota bacterium]|nr:tRNA epoxyqueuosine(34) reductase QueG [Chloroflexota bacterium]
MPAGDLTRRIKEYARAVGFDAVGVARAEPFAEDRAVLRKRIAAGHFSGLSWFTAERADFSSDPRNLLPTARSILSLAMSYRPHGLPTGDAGAGEQGVPRGRISAYAWGRDYHAVLKERMERVVAFIRDACGPAQQARTLVDTARILDRAAARRAGVGWVGKHSNVITKAAGSWVFLGEILTELELEPDEPLRTNCGSCDLCMRACPTGAIVAPYVVDSNRCISYLTIEHRGAIPRELRPLMGNWIFGCDLCQDVCPPNLRPGVPAHEEFRLGAADPAPEQDDASPGTPELIPLLTISPEEFRRRFGRTPVKRAKREGLQRNVAVALGNSGDRAAVPALARALREATPLVRVHAAWALGRLGGADAAAALRSALQAEEDSAVRAEIEAALTELGYG